MNWGLVATMSNLAWRYLWRNYRRTLIMLAAISVGVWAMVFVNALMRGMTDNMVRNGLRLLPGEVQIHHPAYRSDPSVANVMAPPQGRLLQALQQPPITAWAARVRVPAVVASEYDSRGVVMLGVNPAAEEALDSLPTELVAGRFLHDGDDRGVVIGASLARRLATRVGKRVVLMSQDPNNEVADRGARVVGIYKARLQGTEDVFIYTGLGVTQAMLGLGNQVSEVAATADNYRDTASWYPALAQAAGAELETLPWTALDTYLSTFLGVQDGFALIFIVVVFAALSFGLVNTLVMAVFERLREIGLMQALGMRPQLVLLQVLLESFYLLVLGLLVGNLLAWLSIKPLESGIDISAVAQGMEMLGVDARLYPVLAVQDMALATVVVLVLGLLASLLPAWRAARLDPVRALNAH
jgi:ABC-type lipoprotein release transport system permease subunit